MSVYSWRTLPSTRPYVTYLIEGDNKAAHNNIARATTSKSSSGAARPASARPGAARPTSARPGAARPVSARPGAARPGGRAAAGGAERRGSGRPTSRTGSSRPTSGSASHPPIPPYPRRPVSAWPVCNWPTRPLGVPRPYSSRAYTMSGCKRSAPQQGGFPFRPVCSIPYSTQPMCTRPPVVLQVPWDRFIVPAGGMKYVGLAPFTNFLTATTFQSNEIAQRCAADLCVFGTSINLESRDASSSQADDTAAPTVRFLERPKQQEPKSKAKTEPQEEAAAESQESAPEYEQRIDIPQNTEMSQGSGENIEISSGSIQNIEMQPGSGQNIEGAQPGSGQAIEGLQPGSGQNMERSQAELLPGSRMDVQNSKPGSGQSVAGLQPGSGQNVAGSQPGSGQNMQRSQAELQPGSRMNVQNSKPGSGQSVAGSQPGSGQNAAGLQPGSGQRIEVSIPGSRQNLEGSQTELRPGSGENIEGAGSQQEPVQEPEAEAE